MNKTGNKLIWLDKPVVQTNDNQQPITNNMISPVSDEWTEKRLKTYKKQDEKENKLCDLTVQQFRTLLKVESVVLANVE